MARTRRTGRPGRNSGRFGWRALKRGEKVAVLSAWVAALSVVVAVIGLVPPFHDMVAGEKSVPLAAPSSAVPVRVEPSVSVDPKAAPVKIDKIDFPPVEAQSMAAPKPLATSEIAPMIKRLNHNDPSTLRSDGYVPVDSSTISLHMEGNAPSLVRIVGMRAVATCRAPLNGLLIYNPPAGAGDNPRIGFDLDEPNAPARVQSGEPGSAVLKGQYFVAHEYDLKPNEPVTFVVTVKTGRHYCEFHFVLDLLVGGRPETQTIDDGGKPFSVSAGVQKRTADGLGFDFAAYRMFLTSPIVSGPPRTWRLGDRRHLPIQ